MLQIIIINIGINIPNRTQAVLIQPDIRMPRKLIKVTPQNKINIKLIKKYLLVANCGKKIYAKVAATNARKAGK